MAYIEREIVIHEPSDYNSNWSSSYAYDDPLERLDRAKLDRGDFYRKMESNTTRNLHVLDSPLRAISPVRHLDTLVDEPVKKSISDGGPSVDSLPRVPEPHTSWRFYTSYDNGEWKRHMVPVYHSEEDVLNTSSTLGVRASIRTDSESNVHTSEALSPSFGLDSSMRRMRIGRPSVYETLQNRRRRYSEGIKRLQGPRSPDAILNSVSYMTPDEIKRRYDVKDYVPRRKTEYGERVIYPRILSSSSTETEPKLLTSSNIRNDFEEVTRTIHPSYSTDSNSSYETVQEKKPLPPPVIDYGYQEKVIVPTKYKNPSGLISPPPQHAKTILDLLDDPINTSSPRTLSPRRVVHDRHVEPSHLYNVHHVSGYDHSPNYNTEVIRTVDFNSDNNFERRSRVDNQPVSYQPIIRPRESNATKEREVVVVVNNSQDDHQQQNCQQHRYQQHNQPQIQQQQNQTNIQQQQYLYQQQNPQQQRMQHQQKTSTSITHDNKQQQQQQQHQLSSFASKQSTTSVSPSRAEELAAHVRSGTMNVMQQMQSQMFEEMKNKCPEAADAMATLLSGGDKESTMEKKEAFAEQVSLWQGGKPVEEKLVQETRYKSNDPISGPQDYVERSTTTRDNDSGFQTVMSSPFVPRQTAQHRHQYKHHPEQHLQITSNRLVSDYQPSSVFYTPDHPLDRRIDNAGMPAGFLNDGSNRQTYQNVSQQNVNKQINFEYAPERKTETGDKIIIPTKYRKNEPKPAAAHRDYEDGFTNYIAVCQPYEPHKFSNNDGYTEGSAASSYQLSSSNNRLNHAQTIPQSSNFSSTAFRTTSRQTGEPQVYATKVAVQFD
ncbi:hypothetical protein HELRODRAFT_166723 [Helobdella robusta]|uniref:Uncharacterized protein n=1 Tax=Helobdella robusta TaxID=6412 RepID=T1EYF6_HELRO|nr:hypothetical protein HELRODRAFT_166723 [Helobdella robusta]ESO11706.1 hypothetical protein HELRODRAFT_166723 [Helobdella robusta]